MLALQVDRQRDKAIYQQIVQQIKSQINRGQLTPGTRLPTVRQLAQELKVTRLTVHNAYSELQAGGWIEATVGRGTFVSASVRPEELLADLGQQSTLEGIVKNFSSISQMTGLRSLAYTFPDTALLPVEEFWEDLVALRDDLSVLMQYGPPQGDPFLQAELATLLKQKRRITVTSDEILVTVGVTQALALITQVLAGPGDRVLVEQPTYHGFLSILKTQGIQPVGLPLAETGLSMEDLERLIVQHRPRFFYTVPNFHNPTGYCLPPENRRDLLALAARHGLLIVEDDTYGLLSYEAQPPFPLKSEDQAETVIYAGGLSKMLLPGLRTGYIIMPATLRNKLLTHRIAADLGSPLLPQRALAHFLKKKKLTTHLRRVLPVYKARRDAMLEALARWMPPEARWTRPSGGFSCWVTLPPDPRLDDLYSTALNQGVAYTPGSAFLAEASPHYQLRLCYSTQPVEGIQESIMVLGTLIQERLAPSRLSTGSPYPWMPLV